jgi:hypothetical protein
MFATKEASVFVRWVVLGSVVGWCGYPPAGDVLGCPGANPTQQSTKTIAPGANRTLGARGHRAGDRKN